jgi:hypothetical protein
LRIAQSREIGSHALERTEDLFCGRAHPGACSGGRHAASDLLEQRRAHGIRKSAYETGHRWLRHVHFLRGVAETSHAHNGFEYGQLG